MTKRINIGHYARVPLYIARAPVSEMAKSLWRELAFVSSPEKPAVWVRQQNFISRKIFFDKVAPHEYILQNFPSTSFAPPRRHDSC